jgi:hypothetical protein
MAPPYHAPLDLLTHLPIIGKYFYYDVKSVIAALNVPFTHAVGR